MKQFTKKEIEKRFKALYPEGEICLEKNEKWYTINENSKCITINPLSNLYDIALQLNLTTKEEVYQMKKSAGYVNYK